MIREATPDDVPELVAMGGEFIASVYAGRLGDDAEARAALMHRLIGTDDMALFVMERDAGVTGMIGMVIYPNPISGERTAGEVFWWVAPDARGSGVELLARAEAWAKAHGARKIQMVAPNARVARLYERRGYRYLETVLQREIA